MFMNISEPSESLPSKSLESKTSPVYFSSWLFNKKCTVWSAWDGTSNENSHEFMVILHLRFKDRTSCPIPRGSDCIFDVPDHFFVFIVENSLKCILGDLNHEVKKLLSFYFIEKVVGKTSNLLFIYLFISQFNHSSACWFVPFQVQKDRSDRLFSSRWKWTHIKN